ncbi:hypothetical protein [Terribacillus saccharophilus]|uniref:hypothetical protein n=1 Tax=Terribacillus saccharophilus TaxID=361277 RepID=UPI002989A375|nr:hypothetical protein [Terribacillus saccharophilus]MCM3225235.1 hypothetical protein [Terribacillus saccharophilus]
MKKKTWNNITYIFFIGFLVFNPFFSLKTFAKGDTTPPVLDKVILQDKYFAGEALEIHVYASDSQSGLDVSKAELTIQSPSGKQTYYPYYNPDPDVHGEGEYVFRTAIPKHAESGKWRISEFIIYDNEGNTYVYDSSNSDMSYEFDIESANPDTQPPRVDIDKITEIEKIYGSATLNIQVNAFDDLSGLSEAGMVIESPLGERLETYAEYPDKNNNYLFSFYENRDFKDWKISYIVLWDRAGNKKEYYSSKGEISHNINPVNEDSSKIREVNLSVDSIGGGQYKVGHFLNLEARISGNIFPEFRYFVRDEKGILTNITEYQSMNEILWIPEYSGNYTIIVHAKAMRSPMSNYYYYEAKDEVNINVNNDDLSDVTTTVDSPSPQEVGSTVNLNAKALGGDDVEYRFYAREQNGRLTLLRDYDQDNSFSWIPDIPGTYKIITHAKEKDSSGDNNYYEARDEMTYKISPKSISKVTTTVDAAPPQAVGKSIMLNASANGGENPNYRFYVKDEEGKLTELKGYGKENTVKWTPEKPGTYKLITHAKEEGKKGSSDSYYEARNELTYKVNPEQISKVTTTVDAASPQIVGKSITLNASANGGENLNYRFYVRDEEGKLTELKGYGKENTVKWTPEKPGTYKLITHAKEEGKKGSSDSYYEARNELTYQVNSSAISKVTTTVNLLSPQNKGKTITIKAAALGGKVPEYRFYLRDEKGKLTLLKDYNTSNSVTWTPDTSGKYEIITHVKEASVKATNYSYEQRSSLIYTIN